jgi:hypothetical protein
MADDLRLIQKQLRELLGSNVESLLSHVEDSKLLESSVTRMMGFMRAGDEITRRLIEAENAIARCKQQMGTPKGDEAVALRLAEWERYREQLMAQLQGLTVRLRNI